MRRFAKKIRPDPFALTNPHLFLLTLQALIRTERSDSQSIVQRLFSISTAQLKPHKLSVHAVAALAARSAFISRIGGRPKKRLYSRLN
jgi:hypothetical protein